MENKLIIPVEKRSGKAMFNIFMAVGVGAVSFTFISLQFGEKGEFSWWFSGIAFICGVVSIYMFYELSFLFKKSVKVVIEVTTPSFINVYCEDGDGKKFNELEKINVKAVKQIYILKEKNTKGLNTDSSIEYVLKKDNEKVTLNIFPGDLFSTTDQELNKILYFVQQQNPEIVVGY